MTPLFPSDATLASILQAFVYAGKFPDSFRHASFLTKGRISGDFGEATKSFSERVLDGAMTPEELLEKHTMAPLMENLLDADIAKQWKCLLIEGSRYPHKGIFPNFLSTFMKSRALRCCPKCIQEDLKNYGLAHWHVPHQILGIKHCIYHGDLLCNACENFRCDAKFKDLIGPFQLPSDPCWACGATNIGIRTSLRNFPNPGYLAYSELANRALQGKAWELNPYIRKAVQGHFQSKTAKHKRNLISTWVSYWKEYSFPTLLMSLESNAAENSPPTAFLTYKQADPILTIAIQSFAWKQFGTELAELRP